MTSTFITATSVASGIRIQLAAAGDQVVVIQGVTYGSDNERVIYGANGNHSVIIEGSVISGAQVAIELYIGGNEVTVGAAGSVRSSGTLAGYSTLSLFGANNTLWNQGTISNSSGIAAMFFGSPGSAVVNSGTIAGAETGLYLYNSSSFNVVNSGTIEGGTSSGFGTHAGIVASVGEAILIDNSGVIRGNGFGANAIDLSGGGTGAAGPSVISNSGAIISLNGIAVSFQSYGVDNTVRIENFGLIRGGTIAISASDAANVVVNAGTIDGDVILRDGADLYDGIGGVVYGVIDGGAGDDVYRISDPLALLVEVAAGGNDRVEATVSWNLLPTPEIENLTLLGGLALDGIGNALGNVLRGNQGDNRLQGLAGDDTLYGANGDDRLDGGLNNDRAYGGNGDDALRGRDGTDQLEGGSGDDVLWGATGNDSLTGGDDDDLLFGGSGRDALTGGNDADLFALTRLGDSGTTLATRDVISDFLSGVDLIDLSRLDAVQGGGDDAFVFIGAAAFSSVAGQMRFRVNGATVIVEGDVNGDGAADFSVVVNNMAVLGTGDFVM